MKSRPERYAFAGSLAILAFLYGFGCAWFGWFPGPVNVSLLESAAGLHRDLVSASLL